MNPLHRSPFATCTVIHDVELSIMIESGDPVMRASFLISNKYPSSIVGWIYSVYGFNCEVRGVSAVAFPAFVQFRWAPNKNQLGEYLPLVAGLLNESAEEVLKKNDLSAPIAELFRKLVLATAWQESCWRQYVVSDKTITPLRSSTG